MEDEKEFYVDPNSRGWIKAKTFFSDDMAGMLVGVKAQEICDLLNLALRIKETEAP